MDRAETYLLFLGRILKAWEHGVQNLGKHVTSIPTAFLPLAAVLDEVVIALDEKRPKPDREILLRMKLGKQLTLLGLKIYVCQVRGVVFCTWCTKEEQAAHFPIYTTLRATTTVESWVQAIGSVAGLELEAVDAKTLEVVTT